MKDVKTAAVADTFNIQLKQALEHFTHPAWLGEHSPLAMPYFLGEHLWRQPGADTAAGRGRALQRLLRDAAEVMARQDEEGQYAQHVLDLTFFRPQIAFDILDTLGVARATYYRHLSKAIQRLGVTLIRCVKPALRLESPAMRPAMVGREEEYTVCLHPLRQGQSVALTGAGGIGKTTLGAALAACLAPQSTFWCTIRPHIGDQLRSLLFSLGYFLHGQGASSLWLQLVADGGNVDMKIAPGLVRYDLKSLHGAPLLLSFDDLDLLRPAELEEHARLLTFLESLRGLAPLIFISQRRLIEADLHYTLKGLALPRVAEMLGQAQIQLSQSDLARLHDYTGGNPRLLELFITLHCSGESLTDVLQRVSTTPSLEFLLNRTWQRLDEDEQSLLNALSVFRRHSPSDAWQPEQAVLDRLIARNLVQVYGQGGVALLPALRKAVYNQLTLENRAAWHLVAAGIRAERGEHTAAAYHYLKAGKPEIAIWVWYNHREQEIDQGQVSAALRLFEQIAPDRLREEDRARLVLLRNELQIRQGYSDPI